MILKLLATAAAVVTLTQFVSCSSAGPPQRTSIAELVRTPALFDGKSVIITGRVTDRLGLMGAGGFRLADPGGAALVVIGLSSPPRIGEETTVTGAFRMAYAIGEHDAAVVLAR